MNTLRRISRPLVKTFAVGAVMVAAALPAMALSGTASAATAAPTITCSVASSLASPVCAGPTTYATIGQGFGGNFVADGTNFADDQAVGGAVTLTTTAPGVTFSNVNETSTTALTATIDSSSTTTPGFYPVTLTDDNGTVTETVGLGVDNGPQIKTITGNAGTLGGAASTVTVTGSFLNDADVTLTRHRSCGRSVGHFGDFQRGRLRTYLHREQRNGRTCRWNLRCRDQLLLAN